MYKLEIKQGSFIQQTQYFILVEINDFYRICPDFFHLSRRTTVIQDLLVIDKDKDNTYIINENKLLKIEISCLQVLIFNIQISRKFQDL